MERSRIDVLSPLSLRSREARAMTEAPVDAEYLKALEEKVKELQAERNRLKAQVEELLRELGSGK
jgi:hypothetical protein